MGGHDADDIFLLFSQLQSNLDLDWVLYCYLINDLTGLLDDPSVDLDPLGELRSRNKLPTKTWKRIVGRFYLTYFLLDTKNSIAHRLKTPDADTSDLEKFDPFLAKGQDIPKAEKLFLKIVSEIKTHTHESGGQFRMVLLPTLMDSHGVHNTYIETLLKKEKIDVLNLIPASPEKPVPRQYFYKNDGHWNERGNRMAAERIYQYLAASMGILETGDAYVRRALAEYYQAVEDGRLKDTYAQEAPVSEPLRKQIRAKYLEVENKVADGRIQCGKPPR